MHTKTFCTLGAAALLGACGGPTYDPIYDVGTAHKDDGAGTLLEVQASIPKATLQRFVDEERHGNGHADFSDVVRAESVFDHAGVGYHPTGHGPPGVNDIAHVDAHFYMISTETREAITCDGEPAPDPAQVPDGVEANVDGEPFGGCAKQMGGHGAVPYEKLTAEMIYGYHDGKLAFVEPMIEVQMLLDEEEIALDVLKPEKLPVEGAWPTRFAVRYTETAIEFVLSGFTYLD